MRRWFLLLLLFAAAPELCHAQQLPRPATAASSVREDRFPAVAAHNPGGIIARPDVEYANYVGFRPLQLDLYLHGDRARAAARPLIVWVHGGGWNRGDSRSNGAFQDWPAALASLAAHGYVVASVNYRLSGEAPFPAQIQDVKAAIRFLRAHARDYGVDPQRVVLWGGSAGGHLASLATLSCGVAAFDPPASTGRLSRSQAIKAVPPAQSDCVQGAVIWYGPFDLAAADRGHSSALTNLDALLACKQDCDAVARAASPITYVGAASPPMLLLHGTADEEVDVAQTRNMTERIAAAGGKVETVYIDGANHGWIGKTAADTRAFTLRAFDLSVAWTDRLVKTHRKLIVFYDLMIQYPAKTSGEYVMRQMGFAILATMAMAAPGTAAAQTDAGAARFRETYRSLVETDTTKSNGDCTLAATRMQQVLVAAGYPADQFSVVVPPELPKQGNLIGTVPGSDARLPAVLLLAHIDVVEAKRSDWKRDPFKLIEENGYLYARGAVDDKAMAASFVDGLVRIRESKFKPRRTIKLALTCGEESPSYFNGVRYLLEKQPEALRAGFAINEGGRGALDEQGRKLTFGVQIGEKMTQDLTITATAAGGHSARPGPENAIARLAAAIGRVHDYRFPVNMTPVTRQFFARAAATQTGQMASDFAAAGAGTADAAALDRIAAAEPLWNAYMRTTCIPTTMSGGHSKNAQPQHAEVNVNCRIMPGDKPEDVLRQITEAVADPKVTVAFDDPPEKPSTAPELTRTVIEPIERIAKQLFPGVPVIPSISTGATDGRRLIAAGVPTYGVSGVFGDPDGNGVHGLDERVRISSLMDAREFLYRLIRAYGEQTR